MKILQLLLRPQIGGAETLAAALATEWERLGHTGVVAYLDPPGEPVGRISRASRLRRTLHEIRPDLVVSHSALPNLYASLVTPRRTPLLTVLHSATDDFASRLLRTAEARSRSRARTVIAVSRKQVDEYVSHFPDRARPVLIPNGISDDLPRKAAHPDRPTRVITMARVASQKEPELWLDVVDAFSSIDPDLRFSWAGPILESDARVARFLADARSRGLAHLLLGPSSDVGTDLAAADIYFHPSSREAHSIGVLEAAAVGLPVVCSTDVAETLPAFMEVATFPSGDHVAAVDAVATVVAEHVETSRRARALSERIRTEFSIAQTARAYLSTAGLEPTLAP
jgi:glycosyltransferase involved in cell wall biosynthesis